MRRQQVADRRSTVLYSKFCLFWFLQSWGFTKFFPTIKTIIHLRVQVWQVASIRWFSSEPISVWVNGTSHFYLWRFVTNHSDTTDCQSNAIRVECRSLGFYDRTGRQYAVIICDARFVVVMHNINQPSRVNMFHCVVRDQHRYSCTRRLFVRAFKSLEDARINYLKLLSLVQPCQQSSNPLTDSRWVNRRSRSKKSANSERFYRKFSRRPPRTCCCWTLAWRLASLPLSSQPWEAWRRTTIKTYSHSPTLKLLGSVSMTVTIANVP